MAEQDQETRVSDQHPAGAAEGSEQTTAAEPVEQDLRALLDAARTEADQQRGTAEQYLNLLQRVQADFLNYKRRVEAEREARAEATRAETILAFLPVVDDLERALSHVPPGVGQQGWAQGFGLIGRNLKAVFERLGVRRLGQVGEPFDPNVHEAVSYEAHASVPEGHLAAVYRPGYQLGERVVRPAQVVVASAAGQGEPAAPEAWSGHQSGARHPNGGVGPEDLSKPRDIERAGS